MERPAQDLVQVHGACRSRGQILGRLQAPVLAARVRCTIRVREQQAIPEAALRDRIAEFREYVQRAAPEWLSETEGAAEAAGLHPDDLLLHNCLPTGFYPPAGNNCTTFLSIGKERNLLFKIRDTRRQVQSFHTQAATGKPRTQYGRAIGSLGVGHFLNQHGLAGACNTGGHTRRVGKRPTFDDCHTLRYFAEHAASVEDIPPLYERLMALGVVGGAGENRGAIYLFADSVRGLMLECVEDDCVATFFDQSTHVVSNHFLTSKAQRWGSRPPNINSLRRLERMESMLEDTVSSLPSPEEVFRMSRDRKHAPHCLCNDDGRHFWMTVSAHLQTIPRGRPEQAVTYACCGNTRHSVYLPVPIAVEYTFLPHLDGTLFNLADRLYETQRCSDHLRTEQLRFERRMLAGMDYAEAGREALSMLGQSLCPRGRHRGRRPGERPSRP